MFTEDKIIELYKDVPIYQEAGTFRIYFYYGFEKYEGYLNLEDAHNGIDNLMDPYRNNIIKLTVIGQENYKIPNALVEISGFRGYTNAEGYVIIEGLATGRPSGTISKAGLWEQTFIIDVIGGYQESFVYGLPEGPPTPAPEPEPTDTADLEKIATHNGIDIYRVVGGAECYFFLNGVKYGPYNSVVTCEAAIDSLQAVIQPKPSTDESVSLGLGWLDGVASWFGGLWSDGVNTGLAILGAIGGIGTAITGLGVSIVTALTENLGEIFNRASDEGKRNIPQILRESTGHSPEWKQESDGALNDFMTEQLAIADLAAPSVTPAADGDKQEQAKTLLEAIRIGVIAGNVGIFLAHVATEAATLGQVEAVSQVYNMIVKGSGAEDIAIQANRMMIDKSIIKPAEQWYNKAYTPEIPPYSDLINMLVKEKISQEEFNKNLAYQGYSEKWAGLIWDAHFQAPNLGDILTAWRRGLITEEQVDQLMILVDLDPAFKYIFDTRKYDDPSLSTARLMYETGVISVEEVQEIVKRSGLSLDFQPRMVDYIITFQERRWRTRYLQSLATGYSRGVVEKDELTTRIKEAGYSEGTAEWIVKSSDIRKEIGQRGERFTGPKLLNVADLKKSLERGYITEDQFRQEMLLRNYNLNDIDIMIRLLKEDVTEFEQGGVKVALTQSELLNAWRYNQLSEDALRIELQLRGLEAGEVEMLIATKKAQWKLGEEET